MSHGMRASQQMGASIKVGTDQGMRLRSRALYAIGSSDIGCLYFAYLKICGLTYLTGKVRYLTV